MQPETVTSISSPDRKPAVKSDFSSNISSTSDNEYSVNGADSPIPRLPFQGGFIGLWRRYFNPLVRVAPGIQLPIAIYIIGQTESAARRPEYAKIPIKELMMLTGMKERMNWEALSALEDKGLMKRDGHGGYKMCLENIDDVPLTAARTCRRKPKNEKKKHEESAAVHAPSSIAALQQKPTESLQPDAVPIPEEIRTDEIQEAERRLPELPASNLSVGSNAETNRALDHVGCRGSADPEECRDVVSESGFEVRSGDEIDGSDDVDTGFCIIGAGRNVQRNGRGYGCSLEGHLTSDAILMRALFFVTLERDALQRNAAKPETYCTWNWTCPHLSTASELVNTKQKKEEEQSTTTAARDSAGEIQNPYLARFLNPAQRIGDELQIDDAAAAKMWTESVAVNPALTPREFVLVVRMKLQEWRRVDDTRPGRKIRSVVGMLIRSMPNAVQGALYLAAHEQAADELARDVRNAEEILAGECSPRERAWALGILSESET